MTNDKFNVFLKLATHFLDEDETLDEKTKSLRKSIKQRWISTIKMPRKMKKRKRKELEHEWAFLNTLKKRGDLHHAFIKTFKG